MDEKIWFSAYFYPIIKVILYKYKISAGQTGYLCLSR